MADTYRTIISPRASQELDKIYTDLYAASPGGAKSAATRLVDGIDSLTSMADRFKVHESRSDPKLTTRAMSISPYIVYYRVDQSRLAVDIVSIRHGARRQPKRFR